MSIDSQNARPAGHAYIIAGDSADAEALKMAASLVCSGGAPPCGDCIDCRKASSGAHSDIMTLSSPDADIKIADLRAFLSQVYIRPLESDRRVFVIPGAGRLGEICQNTLLKVLEEPPDYAHFLLAASSAGAFLPTVRSRCVILNLPPQESGTVPDGARELVDAALSGNELDFFLYMKALEKMPRAEFAALLDGVIEVLGRMLESSAAAGKTDRAAALIRIVQASRYRCGRNVGLPLISGALAAQFAGRLKNTH